jgi:hypothetical protein
MGLKVDPTVTARDPRTGLTNTLAMGQVDPAIVKQMFPVAPTSLLNLRGNTGLRGAAQRALITGTPR